MQTLYFRDYQKTGDVGYDLYRLLTDLHGKSDIRVVFDPCVYEIAPDRCFERNLCVSNHGWNGPKRIAAVIEDMHNVEFDFNGATVRCLDVMTPFALLRSQGVTIKNVVLENPDTMIFQGRVVAHGDGYIDMQTMYGSKEQFFLRRDGELAVQYGESVFVTFRNVEFRGETGEIEYGTADITMSEDMESLHCEEIGKDLMRVHGVTRYPPIGNYLVFSGDRRVGAGFFCEDTEDIHLENVTIHTCYGMGLLAQTCHNLTLINFNTVRWEDRMFTANADATHFVNCTGLVTVENCSFEGQLDDALNIHGMYTRIVDKSEHELFVREVHSQAKGIRIYRAGDRIQILEPAPLIPYTEKTIKEVEYINADTVRLVLEENTDDVRVGDDVESLTRAADLIFRNNKVYNNRARGMLIATRGKTLIENCYFHTSGSAILFESSGDEWFESGGVQDVTIRGNVFDTCKHGNWGHAVVDCVPRSATVEGKYFNREIKVLDNEFRMYNEVAATLDNIEHAVFTGNKITAVEGVSPVIEVHHVGNAELQDDIPVR